MKFLKISALFLFVPHATNYTMDFNKYLSLKTKLEQVKEKFPNVKLLSHNSSTIFENTEISAVSNGITQRSLVNGIIRSDLADMVFYKYTNNNETIHAARLLNNDDTRYSCSITEGNTKKDITNGERVFKILKYFFKNHTPKDKIHLPYKLY